MDNVDEFRVRPVNAVCGLVPDASVVIAALRERDVEIAEVIVLHGPEGVRILDQDGTRHGWHARFIRFFQNWGFDDAVLNLYDEGLRKGESVMAIPSTPEDRADLARLLSDFQGHALIYFGERTAESLSGP